MKIICYDLETNGLLTPKANRDGSIHPPMDIIWTFTGIELDSNFNELRRVSACNQPGYENGQSRRGWENMSLEDALSWLMTADLRVGHNIQDFDERAIPLVYKDWWQPKPGSKIIDTILVSRLLYPDIAKTGPNSHKCPKFMLVRHGLEAWGHRLGEHKGEYKGGWLAWNEDMQAYGEQDTVVLVKLFKWLMAQNPSQAASVLEHGFAAVIRRQETRGFCFDYDKAVSLLAKLTTREQELEASLIATFGEWWEFGKAANSGAGSGKDGSSFEEDEDADDPDVQEERRQAWLQRQQFSNVVIPTATRNVKMVGQPDIVVTRFSEKTGKPIKPYIGPPLITYTQGCAYTPIKRVQFNPSSRTHIRKRLIALHGWEPVKFTKGGKNSPPQPVVDDAVLMGLPWPEAQLLAEYYLVLKRIGMLATGKKAWMKVARVTEMPNGRKVYRIHGKVNTMGAGTFRCTHSDPNLAQVPANHHAMKEYPDQPWLWGEACRDLFIPGPGYELVGFDGSALELRMLAHYLERYDKGEYGRIVDEGRKEDGTDPHSWLRDLVGTNLLGAGGIGRDHAKTTMYAFLYGAGNEKLGSIVMPSASLAEKKAQGATVKEKVLDRFTALSDLQGDIETRVEQKGSLMGLDRRVLRVRKAHAALNSLLQSAGAIVMKAALVLLDAKLQANGLIPGTDYEFVANVHDEAQAEVLPKHVLLFQRLALEAVEEAGVQLRLKCPLKAEASSGPSWKFTH